MARTPAPPVVIDIDERPGPAEFRDPLVRREMARAAVWLGMALALVGIIVLAQPLLLIVGGAVFAVLLDGGTRLLGRILPIPRGWRLLITILLGFSFLGWVVYFAGTTISHQAESLRQVVTAQFHEFLQLAERWGVIPKGQSSNLGSQLLGSVGRLTSALGTAIGAVTGLLMMLVIGMFLAAEPRLYDRGVAWMLPLRHRAGFYRVAAHVGFTLRRLLFGRLVGMIFEGFFTWVMLTLGGVPMAALLGLVTGLLMMLVIGMFLASEPRLYDRGVAWMLPQRNRAGFYRIANHVGFTLRRLLFGRFVGMVFEGVFTFIMLSIGGVPMAALLGLVTGLLAFIPNIGAITSGILMVAVGFSAGTQTGLWAIMTYFVVQNIDGYLVVPYIARKTVDLAPALVLAMQLLMGTLFGFLGVLFADPILATIKVVLVDLSDRSNAEKEAEAPAPGGAADHP